MMLPSSYQVGAAWLPTHATFTKSGNRTSRWDENYPQICCETLPNRTHGHSHWAADTKDNQGKDATEEFDPIHPPDTLEKYLDKSKHLGPVDMSTVLKEVTKESPEEKERQKRIGEMPPLDQCYNLMDFEAVARRVMKKTAWGYYSSAADDEIVCAAAFPSLIHPA